VSYARVQAGSAVLGRFPLTSSPRFKDLAARQPPIDALLRGEAVFGFQSFAFISG
jgi:hypothetical protein